MRLNGIKSSEPSESRMALYRYDPATEVCSPEEKRPMSTGQLLCHIGCAELENWDFVGQTTVCGFTATCYFYSPFPNNCDTDGVKIIVLEYCPPTIYQRADEAEQYFADSVNETGGVTVKKHQFAFNLTPAEFQLIYNLLGDVKIESEQALQDNDLDKQTRENKVRQYEVAQNLASRIRRDMDNWLLHYPLHTYTQWRMTQLQEYSEEIMKLFDLENKEGR